MTETVVLSGKGGTGKTSLSAAFATLGSNTVVADCDVETANLHLLLQPENYHEEQFISGEKAVINYDTCANCGICINYCRFDAILVFKGHVHISETLCDGCKLCSRICPSKSITMVANNKSRWYAGNYRNGKMIHARLAPGEENSGKLVNIVRQYARKVASEAGWDNIIIDGPPGTGCPVISSLTGATKVIIVTEPTQSGFHDMKRVIELANGFRIKTYIVINRFDLNIHISGQIADWCREMNIPVVGEIPFDKQMVEAMLHCKSIAEWQPGSLISRKIINIWHKVKNDE